MIPFDDIVHRLKFHEGFSEKPYKCSEGFLTIGIGRNLITNPLTEQEKAKVGNIYKGISFENAKYLLRNDIVRCKCELAYYIDRFNTIDDERQYALLDMCFQLGIKGLLKFKKMLNAIFIGDYQGASKECLLSKYHQQTPQRCERIAKLIETGIWSE